MHPKQEIRETLSDSVSMPAAILCPVFCFIFFCFFYLIREI